MHHPLIIDMVFRELKGLMTTFTKLSKIKAKKIQILMIKIK